MNCIQVKELRDAYRDGELMGQDAQALEQHLADCPHCETLWRRESAWLGVLNEKKALQGGLSSEAFTAQVVRRWHRAEQPSVLARISRYSAAAAIVALLLSIAAVLVTQEAVRPGGSLAHRGGSPVRTASAQPLSVLLGQARQSIHTPRQAINRTASFADLNRYVDYLPSTPPMPNFNFNNSEEDPF